MKENEIECKIVQVEIANCLICKQDTMIKKSMNICPTCNKLRERLKGIIINTTKIIFNMIIRSRVTSPIFIYKEELEEYKRFIVNRRNDEFKALFDMTYSEERKENLLKSHEVHKQALDLIRGQYGSRDDSRQVIIVKLKDKSNARSTNN